MNDNDQQDAIISGVTRWYIGVVSLFFGIIIFFAAFVGGFHRRYFLIALYLFVIVGSCLLPKMISKQFFRILLVWSVALPIYFLIFYLEIQKSDLISGVIGLVIGSFAGYIGGLTGGWISGYYDPITKWTIMDKTARYVLAKGGAESAAISGAIAGFITGGVAGVLGNLISPILLIALAALLFWFIAVRIEIAAGETIMGYPGGVILGAVLGVVGGYLGRYIAIVLFSY